MSKKKLKPIKFVKIVNNIGKEITVEVSLYEDNSLLVVLEETPECLKQL